jgi:restriction system protein
LINAVSRNHDQIYSMDPIRFELLVGSVLRDFFDCEVRHVGHTGDGGVDLIAIIGNSRKLIQVKRRSKPDAAESIETVKLMFATTLLERESEAMIVTSAESIYKRSQGCRSQRFFHRA